MRILFWNVRGLNSGGRRRQLGELMNKYLVDVVCLQETIKQKFSNRDLAGLARGQDMSWEWVPPEGRSGGLLLGTNNELFEQIEYKSGRFYQCVVLKVRQSGFIWGAINVYGPVQIELKPDFLRDLMDVIMATEVPLIVGGDFNLVREAAEKSTGNVNESLVQLFNQFVDDVSLREMHRQGGVSPGQINKKYQLWLSWTGYLFPMIGKLSSR
jgi:exonuclease III